VQPTAPAADAVWSRYGDKRRLVFVLIGVLVFAGLTALGCNAFASGDFEDGVEKVIGGIITGFFAVGFFFCALAAVMFPARRHRLPGVGGSSLGRRKDLALEVFLRSPDLPEGSALRAVRAGVDTAGYVREVTGCPLGRLGAEDIWLDRANRRT
jgi:hypothetical protein